MIIGILLISDNVSNGLRTAAGSVFVHVNSAVFDLHEVI